MTISNDIIKEKLAELKMVGKSYYAYNVNEFVIKICTHGIQEHPELNEADSILNYKIVDVYLYEKTRSEMPFIILTNIYLEEDARFKNYTPIKYAEWAGYSTGVEMPIAHLCELIKYLHRLSSLSIFR